MPLRFCLIALVAVALAVSFALGGVVALLNTSRSVRTEMRSALLMARGVRAAKAQPVKDHCPFGGVPHWFVRLIGVGSETERVAIVIRGQPYGTMVIETDPRSEIREAWSEPTGSLLTLPTRAG